VPRSGDALGGRRPSDYGMNTLDEASRRAAIVDQPAKPTSSAMQQIARGSAWMIAARWSMRGIGLISTIILARLLEPTDFGVVAMAMVAVGFIRVFSEAGQDLAVIRHPNPTAEHFDTAWTMSVCAGFIVALVLVAIAPLAGWYYHEPRVVPVIRFIAIVPLVEGFINVGTVAGFQRALSFLITDYPQPWTYGTKQEHMAVSVGLGDGAQQGSVSKGPQ
jgi:lipopolysaccharide exporter